MNELIKIERYSNKNYIENNFNKLTFIRDRHASYLYEKNIYMVSKNARDCYYKVEENIFLLLDSYDALEFISNFKSIREALSVACFHKLYLNIGGLFIKDHFDNHNEKFLQDELILAIPHLFKGYSIYREFKLPNMSRIDFMISDSNDNKIGIECKNNNKLSQKQYNKYKDYFKEIIICGVRNYNDFPNCKLITYKKEDNISKFNFENITVEIFDNSNNIYISKFNEIKDNLPLSIPRELSPIVKCYEYLKSINITGDKLTDAINNIFE